MNEKKDEDMSEKEIQEKYFPESKEMVTEEKENAADDRG